MTINCLILEGDRDQARALRALAEDCGYGVEVSASLKDAREHLDRQPFEVVFLAMDLPRGVDGLALLKSRVAEYAEVVVITDHDDPERADLAIRHGASYVICKPLDLQSLDAMLRDIAADFAVGDGHSTPDGGNCAVDQFGYLRGSSPPMRKLYSLLRKVAHTDASLLVYGESGTGKELVARTVHTLSERSDGPFIAFNCAAVASTLMESELFGHEKGSFSGADRQHLGLFEQAHGGTLLLDEITEMGLELQAKLLRVLETHSIRRVGSEKEIALDVRVVSSTNRAPDDAVSKGLLREDLYYRLAQFPVFLPPLRNRGNDVGGLAQFFLNELNTHHDTELYFAPDTLEQLARAEWPGNVRQLKHAVERAYIVSEAVIKPEAFGTDTGMTAQGVGVNGDVVAIPVGTSLADAEREIILATLDHMGGDRSATAEVLGISVKTLYNRLSRYSA